MVRRAVWANVFPLKLLPPSVREIGRASDRLPRRNDSGIDKVSRISLGKIAWKKLTCSIYMYNCRRYIEYRSGHTFIVSIPRISARVAHTIKIKVRAIYVWHSLFKRSSTLRDICVASSIHPSSSETFIGSFRWRRHVCQAGIFSRTADTWEEHGSGINISCRNRSRI